MIRIPFAVAAALLATAAPAQEGVGTPPAAAPEPGSGQPAEGSQGVDPATAATNDNRSAPVMNADPSAAGAGTGNRAAMTPVSGPELTAGNLEGVDVYGPNDQAIGEVGDFALTADGRVDAIVVDVGGFLGIGSKSVAVAMDNLRFMRDANGTINIYTQFTQDQLKSAPEFNRETYARNRGAMRLAPANAPTVADDSNSADAAAQPAQ